MIRSWPFPGYPPTRPGGTVEDMSNSNPIPPRPFAICFHCDAVEGLTQASEDGWTIYFREQRRFGYLCPSCQHPAEQSAEATTTPTLIRQHSREGSRSSQG